MNYAKYIDYTLLKSDATIKEIKSLCKEAILYGFYSVCVNPNYIKLCKNQLKNTDIKICSVVGFPLGANHIKTKCFEVKQAIKDGVDEIDVVVNIAKIKDKKYAYIEKELDSILKISKGKVLTKIIVETALLDDEEIIDITQIVKNSGAEYIKTSTGFSKRGASISDIKLMKEVITDKISIKASGGINNFEFMHNLILAGANRIGTSHGVEIMQEIAKKMKKDSEM